MISEYRLWRREIKRLFHKQCAICKVTSKLHAHHIVPKVVAPERILDLNNGICVCQNCHKELHALLKKDQSAYISKIDFLKGEYCVGVAC